MHVKPLPHKLKTGLSVVLVGVMGLLATGCASNGSSQATVYPIRVWRYNQDIDPLRDTFNTFEKTHSNANISYERHTLDSYELDALASLASQTGPELWTFPSDWMDDERSRLVPLPDNYFGDPSSNKGKVAADVIKEIYPPSVANTLLGTDGKAYGLATDFDLIQLYYNPNLLSQSYNDYVKSLGKNPPYAQTKPVQQLLSSAPKTWSTLLEQVPYITQKNGTSITRSAIAMGSADNVPVAGDTLSLLMEQNGVDILNSDHSRTLFNTQQQTPSGATVRPGENALDFFTSFALPGRANYTWNPSLPDALDAFAQGKVAMVIAYTDFGKQLKAKYPQFNYQTGPVPQINTTDTPVFLGRFSVDAVTKAASSQLLALQLLYQTDQPNPSNNLANAAKLRSPLLKTLTAAANNDALSKSILTAKTVYKVNHTQFDADFLQMIRDVSQNGATPAGALDVAAQKINDILNPPLSSPTPAN